jgi:dTMP kinase
MSRGKFIVLEGINGSGKSTQLELVGREFYRKTGQKPLLVREPGGSKLGEELRKILKHGNYTLHVSTQVALFMAARAELTHRVILPALKEGNVVLCDRWVDSTVAYQGFLVGGIAVVDIEMIASLLLKECQPDATFILDVPVENALKRRAVLKDADDRWEREGVRAQTILAEAYRSISRVSPDRHLINGTGTPEEVSQQIIGILEALKLLP